MHICYFESDGLTITETETVESPDDIHPVFSTRAVTSSVATQPTGNFLGLTNLRNGLCKDFIGILHVPGLGRSIHFNKDGISEPAGNKLYVDTINHPHDHPHDGIVNFQKIKLK